MNNLIERIWKQGGLVNIEDLRGSAFQAEEMAHTFRIRGVDKSGEPLALTGTVGAVFLRADNTDVAITGTITDGAAEVTLTDECYDMPGRFGLTIYVTSDEQTVAIYAAIGSVCRTSSGVVSPETGEDVMDLINAIAEAVETIPASYTDLMAAVAPTYSTSALYAVGSYAWYSGKLYRCTTAITSGETWTSAHWTQANLGSDVSDLKSALDNIKSRFYDGSNLYDQSASEVGLLRTTNGTIISSYTGYTTTGFIPVEYLDVIRFQFTLISNQKRYDLENTSAVALTNLCYYDINKSFISGDSSTINNYITVAVPTAKYIRVSINDSLNTPIISNVMLVKSNANGVLLPYENYGRKNLDDSYNTPYMFKGKSQYLQYRGAYSQEVKLSGINTSAKGVLISAKADISSFTNVELGLKSGNSVVVSVVVDSTNVVVTDTRFGGSTVITHTFAHGLTIVNEVGVQLSIDNTGIGFVTVSSNGTKYKSTNMNLIRANLGVPYFTASATISNLDFSCVLPMLNKDIWIFGDSYLQQTDSRWIYYMNQNEFNTYLTDAYSGEGSGDAFLSLKSSLNLGKPKYIVWCLGMNDGADSNSLPNATWKNYITAVQEVCRSYDIELIMATIPTVPNINHEYKNSYIRSSGYKYIDFAKAVGAQPDGTWYTGMLSSDNVHPDVAGGIALYNQALTDFPQFAIK